MGCRWGGARISPATSLAERSLRGASVSGTAAKIFLGSVSPSAGEGPAVGYYTERPPPPVLMSVHRQVSRPELSQGSEPTQQSPEPALPHPSFLPVLVHDSHLPLLADRISGGFWALAPASSAHERSAPLLPQPLLLFPRLHLPQSLELDLQFLPLSGCPRSVLRQTLSRHSTPATPGSFSVPVSVLPSTCVCLAPSQALEAGQEALPGLGVGLGVPIGFPSQAPFADVPQGLFREAVRPSPSLG